MHKEILLWDLACHIKKRFINSQIIVALLENFRLLMKQKYCPLTLFGGIKVLI